MITYPDVEDLLVFRSQQQPIISFYLNSDRSRFSLDQVQVAARNLLREGRRAVEQGPWEAKIKEGCMSDLAKLESDIQAELGPGFSHRGIAAFACREAGLYRLFSLPRPVPSAFTVEPTPQIRPLTLILDQYHRFGVLLLDGRVAELYEVYMGEILKLTEAFEAPPPLLTPIDGPGSGDRGMAKRAEEDAQKHFRRAADVLFHYYHRRHYEYLILGGKQPILSQFENYLHPALRELVVGRFPAEPHKTRPAKIMEEVAALGQQVDSQRDKQLVQQLVNSAKSRGLALLGLNEVLSALQRGAVHQLLVEEGWRKPGVICRDCNYLGLYLELCPDCSKPMDRVADIVDEAIESAIRTGSLVEHVHPSAGLAEHGHVGAVLRFKVS